MELKEKEILTTINSLINQGKINQALAIGYDESSKHSNEFALSLVKLLVVKTQDQHQLKMNVLFKGIDNSALKMALKEYQDTLTLDTDDSLLFYLGLIICEKTIESYNSNDDYNYLSILDHSLKILNEPKSHAKLVNHILRTIDKDFYTLDDKTGDESLIEDIIYNISIYSSKCQLKEMNKLIPEKYKDKINNIKSKRAL